MLIYAAHKLMQDTDVTTYRLHAMQVKLLETSSGFVAIVMVSSKSAPKSCLTLQI